VLAAKQWLTFTSGSPLQPAVAHALDELPDWPAELALDLRKRRDLLCAGLGAIDGIDVVVPDGTYFVTTDVAALGWDDGLAFCQALPDRAGVVAIPSQVFHDDQRGPGRHLVRWAFCKTPELIGQGIDRLAAADLTG
jgi:N-succinyldiaminopimelate aminotransferase